jgi:anti-sigma-K factor RskA
MITHEEATDLLASFALDAVADEEQEELEAHLAECPRCRAELDGFRDVAAAMGNSVEPLPEGLWSSIASRLPERQDTEPPPMPRLVAEAGVGEEIPSRHANRRRVSRGPITAIGSFALAAAAVAAVLGIGLARADNQVTRDNAAIANGAPSTVVAALLTPGHQVVDLKSADRATLARFVVVPDGRGYLVSSKLPRLRSDQIYQLWGVTGKQSISLGLLGSSPKQAIFTMDTSTKPSRLSVTVEPSGGSQVPSSPVVASGVV